MRILSGYKFGVIIVLLKGSTVVKVGCRMGCKFCATGTMGDESMLCFLTSLNGQRQDLEGICSLERF